MMTYAHTSSYARPVGHDPRDPHVEEKISMHVRWNKKCSCGSGFRFSQCGATSAEQDGYRRYSSVLTKGETKRARIDKANLKAEKREATNFMNFKVGTRAVSIRTSSRS